MGVGVAETWVFALVVDGLLNGLSPWLIALVYVAGVCRWCIALDYVPIHMVSNA